MSVGNKILGGIAIFGALRLLPTFVRFVIAILLIGAVFYGVEGCLKTFFLPAEVREYQAEQKAQSNAYKAGINQQIRYYFQLAKNLTAGMSQAEAFERLKESWYENHHPGYRDRMRNLGEEWSTEVATKCLNAIQLNSIKDEDGADSCADVFDEWGIDYVPKD